MRDLIALKRKGEEEKLSTATVKDKDTHDRNPVKEIHRGNLILSVSFTISTQIIIHTLIPRLLVRKPNALRLCEAAWHAGLQYRHTKDS
jgi:hypothetical protein